MVKALPDFSLDPDWNRILNLMGAVYERIDFIYKFGLNRSDSFSNDTAPPLEIHLSDLESININKFGFGGRGVAYLKKQSLGNLRKYHIEKCETLTAVNNKGESDKFFVHPGKNGVFPVLIRNSKTNETTEEYIELNVCKHCLRKINYSGYANSKMSEKQKIVLNFSLPKFYPDD